MRGYERREAGFIIEGGDGQRWSREYYCTGDIWGQPRAATGGAGEDPSGGELRPPPYWGASPGVSIKRVVKLGGLPSDVAILLVFPF